MNGIGLGLRPEWAAELLGRQQTGLRFLEILADNFLRERLGPLDLLKVAAEQYPVTLHSVGMNIGSIDPIDWAYIDGLGRLAEVCHPVTVSDHLCWVGAGGVFTHDLLPLPLNEESIRHCAGRIAAIQDRLGRRISVENVSRYVRLVGDELPEWEFVVAVAHEADCGVLLDVNNIVVSARNLGFDARGYVDAIPAHRVTELHVAGFDDWGDVYVDRHGSAVSEATRELLSYTLTHFSRGGRRVPTSLERDNEVPPLDDVLAECALLQAIWDDAVQ